MEDQLQESPSKEAMALLHALVMTGSDLVTQRILKTHHSNEIDELKELGLLGQEGQFTNKTVAFLLRTGYKPAQLRCWMHLSETPFIQHPSDNRPPLPKKQGGKVNWNKDRKWGKVHTPCFMR